MGAVPGILLCGHALSEMLGSRPQQLADVLQTAGNLLLGDGAWSISKVREDGFFAWLHKFTGIVIDTSKAPNVMVSFTADRLQKMKELLLLVDWSLTHLTLGLVQTVFGNLMWITKVYTMLKAWLAPWRRAMQGVTSNAEPSQRVSTKMPNETEALATKKLRKDTHMRVQFLDHMMAMKQEIKASKLRNFRNIAKDWGRKGTKGEASEIAEIIEPLELKERRAKASKIAAMVEPI